MGTGGFPGGGDISRSEMLSIYLHILPSLRMSGAMRLLPMYAFMA